MSLLSMIQPFLADPQQQQVLEEQLDTLNELGTTYINLWQAETEQMYLNPDAYRKKGEIPGSPQIDKYSNIDVHVQDTVDEKINQAFDSLFNFDLDGLKKAGLNLVKTGVSSLLGNYAGKSHFDSRHEFIPQASGIVRLDYWIWRRRIGAGGLLTHEQEVIAYYYVTSSVDLSTLTKPEILNILNKMVDQSDPNAAEVIKTKLKEWKDEWDAVPDFHALAMFSIDELGRFS
jgi:hypothetical protein